ncbi:hypothetical protein CLI86_02060 [Tannerella forsythia]|uniref:Uncharacterized protein n=1 Tax=Tannerella forsythia TaxID=28112 RepID=A0A2A6EAA8_TANFO|nr:hypothetical protein CLI86_02060 [Tannerella forsythia]
MKAIRLLLGFLPGVSVGMWLRAMWFCVSLAICNPTDDCSLWVVFGLAAQFGGFGAARGARSGEVETGL